MIYYPIGVNQITLPEVTMNNTIKVLIVEPEKPPRVEEISHTLESLQQIVGGYIQALYPFDDPVAIICNEAIALHGTIAIARQQCLSWRALTASRATSSLLLKRSTNRSD